MADRLDRGVRHRRDPLAAEHRGEQLARFRLLGADETWAGLEDRDARAEAREHLGELDADRPSPDDRERRGHLGRLDRLAVRPERRARQSLDGGRPRPRADPDDDGGARLEHRVAHDDAPGSVEPPPPAQEPAALGLEPLGGGRVVPVVGRLGSDARRDGRPVRDDVSGPGHALDATRLCEQVGCADHHLRRHAPPVGALAADELRLDPDDVEAGLGEPPCDVLRPRSEPDHDDVCLLGHRCLLECDAPPGALVR